MQTVIFAAAAILFAAAYFLEWMVCNISSLAIFHYITEKGYSLPNDEEHKECIMWATEQVCNGNLRRVRREAKKQNRRHTDGKV